MPVTVPATTGFGLEFDEVARLFREGLGGFEGGLSAGNYIRIAKTLASPATCDLQGAVNRNRRATISIFERREG